MKSVQFDAKTKQTLIEINQEAVRLNQIFQHIVATVANMNGLEDYQLNKDWSGLMEVPKKDTQSENQANQTAE